MKPGTNALQGAFDRAEERPSNNMPMEEHRTRQEVAVDFGQWPDWSNASDFPNWENIG